MNITALRTLVVAAPPHRNWAFVKVETDQPGLFGWGEATLEWKSRAVVDMVEDLAPIVVGNDPRDITRLVELMTRTSFWPLGVIGLTALSAIEQALWDIKGKDLGQPVWALLGGKVRDRVRVYTHIGNGTVKIRRHSRDIASYTESTRELREMGYTAVKTGPVPYTHYDFDLAEVMHTGKLLEGLREAAGDKMDILLDFHGRPHSTRAALAFIDACAPARPMFVEEPIQPGDPVAMQKIADAAGCPIATGERLVTHREFEELCGLRAVTYVQPDLCHCGGFTVGKQIAVTAATFGIGVCPHNPMGPIAGVVGLHFGAAVPNFTILEETTGSVPWYDEVVQTPIRRVNGYWELPTKPGLGIEVNEKAAAAHPFQQEEVASLQALIARDGTIANW